MLHLSRSLWEIPPSLRLVQKKNRPEKFPFTATNNRIVLAVRRSVKYFFAPNSPLFRKNGEEKKKKRGNWEVVCFSSKHNNILLNF